MGLFEFVKDFSIFMTEWQSIFYAFILQNDSSMFVLTQE